LALFDTFVPLALCPLPSHLQLPLFDFFKQFAYHDNDISLDFKITETERYFPLNSALAFAKNKEFQWADQSRDTIKAYYPDNASG